MQFTIEHQRAKHLGGKDDLGCVVDSSSEKERACEEVGAALSAGNIGEIVEKHEKLILRYYEDVQRQAERSFTLAERSAIVGFCVLIVTVVYIFVFDALYRFNIAAHAMEVSRTASVIGLVSGTLIEFTAGVTFLLHSRTARQFSAFHICLERTHRYLLAYKIVEQLQINKDQTLRDLVCIMANAPMISQVAAQSLDLPRPGEDAGAQAR